MSILLFSASILLVVLTATTTTTACSGSLDVVPAAFLESYAVSSDGPGPLTNASSASSSNPDGSGTYTCLCTSGPACTIVFGNDDTVSTTIPGSAVNLNAPAGTGSVVLSSVSIVCNQATGQLTTPDGTLVTRVACFDFF